MLQLIPDVPVMSFNIIHHNVATADWLQTMAEDTVFSCSFDADSLTMTYTDYQSYTLLAQLLWCTFPCEQQGHAGSKTLHRQNPPVVNWRCWLTQADLYNGHKTVVVVLCFHYKLKTNEHRNNRCQNLCMSEWTQFWVNQMLFHL